MGGERLRLAAQNRPHPSLCPVPCQLELAARASTPGAWARLAAVVSPEPSLEEGTWRSGGAGSKLWPTHQVTSTVLSFSAQTDHSADFLEPLSG